MTQTIHGLTAALCFLVTSALLAICNTAPTSSPDTHLEPVANIPIVIDVLANDTDPDGQALTLLVVGENCEGTATADQDLLRFDPQGKHLPSNCLISYQVRDESGAVSALRTIQITAAGIVIFEDGFESGNSNAWSVCDSCG